MSLKKFIAGLAFFATCTIALVLVLSAIFQTNNVVFTTLMSICEAIAFVITAIFAFTFVKYKKHIAWKIIYAVAVTALIALFIVVKL